MLRKVLFEYKACLVNARVHLGTTGATGDDPDDVVSLAVEGVVPSYRLYKTLCEEAIKLAKESEAV